MPYMEWRPSIVLCQTLTRMHDGSVPWQRASLRIRTTPREHNPTDKKPGNIHLVMPPSTYKLKLINVSTELKVF